MTEQTVAASRYKDRSGDFIRSASVICTNPHDGWLPSACLLLGFACELLAKRRLLRAGLGEDVLRNPPYGHDIDAMWKTSTSLFVEGEAIALELLKNPSKNGVDRGFDWNMHFDQLAKGHSRSGDYSLRYHQGEISFASPKAMTVVLASIWLAEPDT